MNAAKKKGLGRGLSALFGDDQPKDENTSKLVDKNKVLISDLSRNPYQPRNIFDES